MKDLFDTMLADSTPDPDTCRALAGYLRRQADRLESHAENLDQAVSVARSLHSALRKHKRTTAPVLEKPPAPPPPPQQVQISARNRPNRLPPAPEKLQIPERNRRIVLAAESGWTKVALARKYKLSAGYIGKIVRAGFVSGRGNGREAERQ